MRDQQEHGEQEAEVANAVDDEGFFAGVGGGVVREVEADEQVGGEADAFPADEQQQEVLGEDQGQHEEHEEVQVGEEAPVAFFVRHVADGVDVDQEADAGDDAEHDEGEVVELKAKSAWKSRRRRSRGAELLDVREGQRS